MNAKRALSLKGYRLLCVLLPSFLALAPHTALALNAATGTSRQFPVDGPGQVIVQANVFSPIFIERFFLPAAHHCTVVGSADLRHRSGGETDNRYEIGLSVDSLEPTFDVRRTVELNDNSGVDDPNFVAVSTTAFFTIPEGFHRVFFVVRRINGPGRANVVDASMTISCFENQLTDDVIL